MVLITLIGEGQAKTGGRFFYNGPQTECRDCKLRTVCFNLEKGAQYEIAGVRDQKHECEIIEGPVTVVEVQKIVTRSAVPKKIAIDGSTITFQRMTCEEIGCENYRICHPYNLLDGEKYKIEKTEDDLQCPLGEKIVLVELF